MRIFSLLSVIKILKRAEEVEDHQARDHKTHARLTAIELVAPTPLQPLGDPSKGLLDLDKAALRLRCRTGTGAALSFSAPV